MDYQKILIEIQKEITPCLGEGKVAEYPALAEVDAKQYAISITLNNGTHYSAGSAHNSSLFKVFQRFLPLLWHLKYTEKLFIKDLA